MVQEMVENPQLTQNSDSWAVEEGVQAFMSFCLDMASIRNSFHRLINHMFTA